MWGVAFSSCSIMLNCTSKLTKQFHGLSGKALCYRNHASFAVDASLVGEKQKHITLIILSP